MITALITFHVIVCVLLIVVVLLQFGKGAETGAVMGSTGSQAVFTSSQQGNIFTKATSILAILFFVNSVAITTIKSKDSKSSIFDGNEEQGISLGTEEAPAKEEKKPETKKEAKK